MSLKLWLGQITEGETPKLCISIEFSDNYENFLHLTNLQPSSLLFTPLKEI